MRKLIAVGLAASLMAGCSAFKEYKQQVNLLCPTPGTLVLIDGKKTDCPSTIDMPRDKGFTVQAYKDGYLPVARNIGSHLATSGKWDIFGTVLLGVPVIGLLTPGAWDLDAEDIVLTMIDPKNPEASLPKPQPVPVAVATTDPVVRNSQGNRVNPITGAIIN